MYLIVVIHLHKYSIYSFEKKDPLLFKYFSFNNINTKTSPSKDMGVLGLFGLIHVKQFTLIQTDIYLNRFDI